MNKQQYQELLKTMKPVHPASNLFGLTHREFIFGAVAVGAVLVAIFK
ncbi:hypothetical protein [Pseudoduganella sp. R-34]